MADGRPPANVPLCADCSTATVTTLVNGNDCLRKLRQLTPAVVVLDLELRWGGGDGVLAWLRQESPGPRMPVVLTAATGYQLELPLTTSFH